MEIVVPTETGRLKKSPPTPGTRVGAVDQQKLEVRMSEANKNLVRAFAEAGNANDLDAFDTLLASDFVRHCEATPEVAVTTCEGFAEHGGAAFPL